MFVASLGSHLRCLLPLASPHLTACVQLNGTIRDNIVFGGDYDAPRLTAVVEACGLADDLRMLPGGEQCEIGERGVT